MTALLSLGSLLAGLVSIQTISAWTYDNHTCALEPRYYSCENTTAIQDTCCSPTQGLILVTQFWDVSTFIPGSLLPNSSWTIHGLWPDHCDGSYGASQFMMVKADGSRAVLRSEQAVRPGSFARHHQRQAQRHCRTRVDRRRCHHTHSQQVRQVRLARIHQQVLEKSGTSFR